MKIECLKEKLIEAVSVVDKLSGKNQNLPILSCVLITADKNSVSLKATNLDVGIEISFPAKVYKEGSVAVPGSILSSFLSTIHDDKKVNLESVDNNLMIKTDTVSTVIKSQPTDDFPVIPKAAGDRPLKVNPAVFVKGLKSVWYAASTSTIKPELSSVYVYPSGDQLVFVSTDSFRLAEKKLRVKDAKDFSSTIIPSKNVAHMIRTLETVEDDVTVYFEKTQIAFESPSLYVVSRVVEGVFPDYNQIIPKSYVSEVVALKNDVVESFKTSNIFSDKFNQVNIEVSPKDKLFQIKTKNSDIGECVKKIHGAVTGDSMDINFNHRYVSDSFQSIDSDSISFSFTGPNKPLVVKGSPDQSFLYLVMPMNK